MSKKPRQHIDDIAGKLISHFKLRDHAKRQDEAEMWQRITDEIAKEEHALHRQKRMRRIYLTVSVAAACAVLLLYIGKDRIFKDTDWNLENYVNQLADVVEPKGEVQLLLSGDKTVRIDKDSVGIVYTPQGDIRINKEDAKVEKKDAGENEFNQVIVPKGKYTRLTLADGTQMHVNSGSRVIYPRRFTGKRREIYVEGEVYLDVTPDKKRPFRVKTSQFEVEVLGTSFNVNAYTKNHRGEVVLVEGSVRLYDKYDREVLLKPDNLVAVDAGQASDVRQVNAADYTAWINGLLILHAAPLKTVFDKLNRFYDIPFVVDPAIQTEIVEGKLDLRLPLPELLRMISVGAPIEYRLHEGVYYINPKKNT